jgi:hypothetical protein
MGSHSLFLSAAKTRVTSRARFSMAFSSGQHEGHFERVKAGAAPAELPLPTLEKAVWLAHGVAAPRTIPLRVRVNVFI